jgi:hypothetical protein
MKEKCMEEAKRQYELYKLEFEKSLDDDEIPRIEPEMTEEQKRQIEKYWISLNHSSKPFS